MTTVAFDGKSMAADRMMTVGCVPVRLPFSKLKRITFRGLPAIMGWSGVISDNLPVLDWVKGGCKEEDRPELAEGCKTFQILIATAEGLHTAVETLVFVPLGNVMWAVGTGGDFAMGAMAQGASAKRAVDIAAQYDTSTGMGVDVLRLGVPKCISTKT